MPQVSRLSYRQKVAEFHDAHVHMDTPTMTPLRIDTMRPRSEEIVVNSNW